MQPQNSEAVPAELTTPSATRRQRRFSHQQKRDLKAVERRQKILATWRPKTRNDAPSVANWAKNKPSREGAAFTAKRPTDNGGTRERNVIGFCRFQVYDRAMPDETTNPDSRAVDIETERALKVGLDQIERGQTLPWEAVKINVRKRHDAWLKIQSVPA